MSAENPAPASSASTEDPPFVDPVIEAHERHRRRAPLRRGCGWALVLTTIFAVLFALPAGVYLAYGVMDRQAYERELALLRESGEEPLTLEQIEAYYPSDPEIERTTQLWLDAVERLDGGYAAEAEPLYLVGDKAENETRFDGQGLLAGSDLADAAAFVDRYREAIDGAHTARLSGAVARYPLKFEQLFAYDGDWTFGLQRLAVLLRLDAEVRMAQGDEEAAVEDVLSMLAAGESLRNEPLLLSQLLRGNIVPQASIAACRIAATAELSGDRLAELQAAFAGVEMADGFRRGLRGDRFMAMHTLRGDSPIGDPVIEEFGSLWFPDASAAKALEFYRVADEATRESLLGMRDAQNAIDAEFQRVGSSRAGKVRYRSMGLWSPMFDASAVASLQAQARANLAATALACERYRLANGDWPAALDELTPDYVEATPLDPFLVLPLRYAVEEQGILLYSVGANRTDEGGAEDSPNYNEGDLVVRLPNAKRGKESP